MLRKIIRPTSENYNLHIPKEYINKDIEILVLPFFHMGNISKEKIQNKKEFNPEEFYNVSSFSKNEIDDYLKLLRNRI